MNKLSLFFLITLLLASCAPATIEPTRTTTATTIMTQTPTIILTPSLTLTPAPTWIPCPEIGTPVALGDIQVIFYAKVAAGHCNDIQKYVTKAQEKFRSLGVNTGPFVVHVFDDPEGFVEIQRQLIRNNTGCTPDTASKILIDWSRGGGGQGTAKAIFIRAVAGMPELDKANAIVHEMTHVAIWHILGSCQQKAAVPGWFGHGLAEYNTEVFTIEWRLTPWPEKICRSMKLEELKPGQECIYTEAQMAFHLMASGRYECTEGMDIIVEMAKVGDFDAAFSNICGVSVSEFSKDFDAYRVAGYRLPPTQTSTPDA